MNRSVLVAIAVPVVVTGTSLGVFGLAVSHGGTSGHQTGASGQAAPGASTGQGPAAPGEDGRGGANTASPSPGHTRGHRAQHRHHGAMRPPVKPLGTPVFVGVAVGGSTVPQARAFAAMTHARLSMVEFYRGFGGRERFPLREASRVVRAGWVPFIQWNPRHAPLTAIAAGKYDSYVRRWASAAKRFGHRIMLSFAHEFNGWWGQWGTKHATPAQFIRAWRHLHNIFAAKHVRNVVWAWDPSHTGAPASRWWPGPAYVDRIGIDGKLFAGQTFDHVFRQQLANIRSVTSKPVFIAETGVAFNPRQVSQIRGLFAGMRRYHLTGFVYFNVNGLARWKLDGRPAAIDEFRRNLAGWSAATH